MNTTNKASAQSTGFIGQRTAMVRFLLVGVVLLAVAVTRLIATVADWSTVPSTSFLSEHALPLAGVVIGVAFIVAGIVKAVRR